MADRAFRVLFALVLFAFAARTILAAVVCAAEGRDADALRYALLAAGELLAVGLLAAARRASRWTARPWPLLLTIGATFGLLFVQLDEGKALVSGRVALALQLAGVLLQLAAKLWLGRSFGLLPAARGLVTMGPYRFVRHPMYLGYLIGHLGWLLVSFTWWNAAILAALYLVQGLRIREEERLLRDDPAFASYATRVRYRLVPFVF